MTREEEDAIEKEWGQPFEDRTALRAIVEEAVTLGVERWPTLMLLDQHTVFTLADVASLRRRIHERRCV